VSALAENGGNAGFCGRSSMAEQKLPKLLTTADSCGNLSKTRTLTGVSFQKLGNREQNRAFLIHYARVMLREG
jgi:hypothetical protein